MTESRFDRRLFLRLGAMGLAGAAGGRLVQAQAPDAVTLASHVVDVNGDGWLGAGDVGVMEQALFTSRGFAIEPNTGFDTRADVFGRGVIGQDAVDAVIHAVSTSAVPAVPVRRPITVGWHYGWYDHIRRPLLEQTVRYLGGDYLSNDPVVESEFNRLKNEFGITVDALSWIPHRVTPTILPNYQTGYFSADNAATRYVSLLYEAALALPHVGGRVDFRSTAVRDTLVGDFAAMAQTLVEARDQYPTRVFLLDGRPVVFLFASHAWGLNPDDTVEFRQMTTVVSQAREAFGRVYGTPPYLVGDELLPLASTTTPSPDRLRRGALFDAVHAYHAANLKTSAAPFSLNESYGALQRLRLERATVAMRGLENAFTSQKVLIIPSLAGGFAKHGMPTLSTTRQAFANYLKLLIRHHEEGYLPQEWPGALGTEALPAPIYSVGSWNEEYEGHAVFPAQFNLALTDSEQHGFDFAMALKEAFGWNHYADRSIS
ncbi:MAG TPA: hypothetical protein EYQ83_15125 [Acidobacteria bacterium]|nr:hypothetical protein [Acidobacteriota bacterium]